MRDKLVLSEPDSQGGPALVLARGIGYVSRP